MILMMHRVLSASPSLIVAPYYLPGCCPPHIPAPRRARPRAAAHTDNLPWASPLPSGLACLSSVIANKTQAARRTAAFKHTVRTLAMQPARPAAAAAGEAVAATAAVAGTPSLAPAASGQGAAGAARGGSKQRPTPLALATVPNLRDLAEACSAVAPGRVLRCAKPTEASPEDVKQLVDSLGIRELVDLRSSEELAEDPADSPLRQRAAMVQHSRDWLSRQSSYTDFSKGQEVGVTAWSPLRVVSRPMGMTSDRATLTHHQVSLLERTRFFVALVQHVPASRLWQSLALRLVSKEQSRQVLLREVNQGGLLLLYKILVDGSQPEIAIVLRLITKALEQQQPVLLFCKAGKDRTGVIAALLLLVAGANEEEVVADYARSDDFHAVALAGIENKPELAGLDRAAFERAPVAAMQSLLQHLHVVYGGPLRYLSHIGFGTQEQERLRRLLQGGRSEKAVEEG